MPLENLVQYQHNPPWWTPDLVVQLMRRDYLPAMIAWEYQTQMSRDAVFTLSNLHIKATPIKINAWLQLLPSILIKYRGIIKVEKIYSPEIYSPKR
jgi:hypothetical protein